ncbi:hypothetical protein TUBRATIS_28860 [Tubulinosema ratisbonensis]|uniref:Uncharacterized protein n=1 Tax=Tubulinosema ratisbonensis TaxID=291195 RepID=A0A437AHM2_9MICR|nr:hypothetical protein TUBRATIS_28860 [Tubulinosema ratisbonensis]
MYFLKNIKTNENLKIKEVSNRTFLTSEKMKSKESILPYNLFYFDTQEILPNKFIKLKHFLFQPKIGPSCETDRSINNFRVLPKKSKIPSEKSTNALIPVEVYSQVLPSLDYSSDTLEGYFKIEKMLSKKLLKSIKKHSFDEELSLKQKILFFFQEAEKNVFLSKEMKEEYGTKSKLNKDRINVMIIIFTLMVNGWECDLEKFSKIRRLNDLLKLVGCKVINNKVKLTSAPKYKTIRKK